MDSFALAAVVGVVGLIVGAGLAVLVISGRRREVEFAPEPPLPLDVVRTLEILPQASMVVTNDGMVIHATQLARDLGLARNDRVTNSEITAMIDRVARTGESSERDVVISRHAPGRVAVETLVRVASLSPSTLLVLVHDLSESRRIEAVRRDFVANVSHELKTPVGALGVLSEAVEAASDEPDQVRHFAGRMRVESARLAALVADIIDLSRLQGADPLEHSHDVDVDRVIAEAIDSTRLVAAERNIEIVRGDVDDLFITGEEAQLVMALRNLIVNAVTYSPEGTRVAVGTRCVNGTIEISVTDQGIGIPEEEQERIFERFYRVDPARSRATGGTGLGLAIVKHICSTHGGDVTVWSRKGEGSTFTLRLPRAEAATERVAS